MPGNEFKIADEKHSVRKDQWKSLFEIPKVADSAAYGYESERAQIRAALTGMLAPRSAEVPFGMVRGVQLGLFLYGPPGCGKTLLVRATAAELGIPLIVVQPAHVVTGDVGSTGQMVSSLFEAGAEVAASRGGAVLFMDEIESYGKRTNNGSGWEVFLSNLLKHIDRVSESSSGSRLVFAAATNNPGSCEPALLSRLSTKIEIGPPTEATRRSYLAAVVRQAAAAGRVGEIDVEDLVRVTRGQTLREIAQGLESVNAQFLADDGKPSQVTNERLRTALKRRAAYVPFVEDPALV